MVDMLEGTMKIVSGCAECERLWQEYSRATSDHIRLEGKLKVAALSYDPDQVSTLSALVQRAAGERTAARDAVNSHTTSGHADSASAS